MAGTFSVVDPVEWVIGGEAESPKPSIAGRSSFEHGRVHGSPDQLGRGGEHERINVERAGAPAPPSGSGEPQLRQGGCHGQGRNIVPLNFPSFWGKSRVGKTKEGKQQSSLTKKSFCATEFSRIGPGLPSTAASPLRFRDEARKGRMHRP
jgi:hypothetical protein